MKLSKKKEKIQHLKSKNNEFSLQTTNLLTIIEKNDKNFSHKKQNQLEDQKIFKKSENIPNNDKNRKYSDLEKYALKILNDFD